MKLELKYTHRIHVSNTNFEWTPTDRIIKHETKISHLQYIKAFNDYCLKNLLNEL